MTDTLKVVLPRPDDIEDVMSALLGRKATATRLAPGTKVEGGLGVLGSYYDEEGVLRVVVFTQYQLVNAAGALLSMIPPGAVEDANDEKEIPSNMYENFREILNIMATMFNDRRQRADHVRLKSVTTFDEAAPEALEVMQKSADRVDINVQLAGYGGGGLTVIVC